MLDQKEIIALCRAEHSDPYAVLGMHTDADGGLWVRSLQPGASAVAVIDAKTGKQIVELAHIEIEGVEGFFEGVDAPPPPTFSLPPAHHLGRRHTGHR
jgi:1,4-alpha-glucan branching enzyme